MKEIGYTEKDVEIIKKYYHTYDFELINSMLDNPHSVKSIKSKAHRLGITSLNNGNALKTIIEKEFMII